MDFKAEREFTCTWQIMILRKINDPRTVYISTTVLRNTDGGLDN